MQTKRGARRLLLGLAFIACGGALAYTLYESLLPDYLHQQILQFLQHRGLDEATFSIERAGPRRLRLSDLRLGTGEGLFIKKMELRYDWRTLQNHRVQEVHIDQAYLALAIQNGKIDWGPLAKYLETGSATLPFNRLTLDNCKLQLAWEGMSLPVDFDAELTPRATDSLDLSLHATLPAGDLLLQGGTSLISYQSRGKIVLAHMSADILQHAQKIFLPDANTPITGTWGADADFATPRGQLALQGSFHGDSLRAQYWAADLHTSLPIAEMHGTFEVRLDSMSTVALHSKVAGTPVTLHAAFNHRNRRVHGTFEIPALAAEALDTLIAQRAVGFKSQSSGQLALAGKFSQQTAGRGTAQITLRSDRFSTQAQGTAFHLTLNPQSIAATANFTAAAHQINFAHALLQIHNMHLSEESTGVTAKGLQLILPIEGERGMISQAEFAAEAVRWHALEFSSFAGSLQWTNPRLDFTAAAEILKNARINLSGQLELDREKLAGELSAEVPAFHLEESAPWAPFLPNLKDYHLSGDFLLSARGKITNTGLATHLHLEAQNAAWQNHATGARVDSLAGTLEIDNLNPLTSAGEQQLSFASARFGDLEITAGEVHFIIAGVDSLIVKSISCKWAGGKLACNDFVIKPSSAEVNLVVHAEALDLQAILDFVRYQGVKGQGKIYGELPLAVRWGASKRIHVGNGYLEARPQAGVLQLSKENAQTLLGIRQEIDPHNASLEEQVSLMVINALQDMAYTNLRVEFTNEPGRGLMTYVRAQGYGPRTDKEKQIPIGGFNVNINHLDDLLNSMIWPNLGAGQLKLD